MRITRRGALTSFATLACVRISDAAPKPEDEKLLKDVSERLLKVCGRPALHEWPPVFLLVPGDEPKAWAKYDRAGGKRIPHVRVSEGMMAKVVDGDADRLAFVLGHELAHLLLGHLTDPKADATPFVQVAFERDQETDADLEGFKFAVTAKFSFEKGAAVFTRMQELKPAYSSFEGLGKGHPSWNDRAAKADKDKSELWRALDSFQTGVWFLTTEDYKRAILCFEAVTERLPEAFEGWANLGYAQLMQYCDQWDRKDFEDQGVGQVLTGGFYTRVESVKVRGKDAVLWSKAVGNLRKANELRQNQPVVLANLGLAHLLDPKGKDVREAIKCFDAAEAAAQKEKTPDPASHAKRLINHAVATLADDDATDKGLSRLEEGEKAAVAFAGGVGAKPPAQFDSAILYNRAVLLLKEKKFADAFEKLDAYLTITSKRSLWWDSAYALYTHAADKCGKKAKAAGDFAAPGPERVRHVNGVTVRGIDVTLAAPSAPVFEKLGPAHVTPIVPGRAYQRIRYEADGVEIIANERIVSVHLIGSKAPAIELKGRMLGGKTVGVLKVGMTEPELTELVGSHRAPEYELGTKGVKYRFYNLQGVAVRCEGGKVAELVIVQIPVD